MKLAPGIALFPGWNHDLVHQGSLIVAGGVAYRGWCFIQGPQNQLDPTVAQIAGHGNGIGYVFDDLAKGLHGFASIGSGGDDLVEQRRQISEPRDKKFNRVGGLGGANVASPGVAGQALRESRRGGTVAR